MERKFGPTRGEYLFRFCAGLVILGLLAGLVLVKGVPGGLLASESILFGFLFAIFLVGHSGLKLLRGDYRRAR